MFIEIDLGQTSGFRADPDVSPDSLDGGANFPHLRTRDDPSGETLPVLDGRVLESQIASWR
jgi:hypothetical protein